MSFASSEGVREGEGARKSRGVGVVEVVFGYRIEKRI